MGSWCIQESGPKSQIVHLSGVTPDLYLQEWIQNKHIGPFYHKLGRRHNLCFAISNNWVNWTHKANISVVVPVTEWNWRSWLKYEKAAERLSHSIRIQPVTEREVTHSTTINLLQLTKRLDPVPSVCVCASEWDSGLWTEQGISSSGIEMFLRRTDFKSRGDCGHGRSKVSAREVKVYPWGRWVFVVGIVRSGASTGLMAACPYASKPVPLQEKGPIWSSWSVLVDVRSSAY